MAQPGLADAEVVHVQPEAAPVQIDQRAVGRRVAVVERALVDVEVEIARIEVRIAEHAIDLRSQVALLEQLLREIDRDREPRGAGQLAPPVVELPRGGLQHPLIDGDDQAGLHRHGEELARLHQPEPRMLPARQRLEALHPAGGDVDDRHVVEQELVAQKGAAQVGLHVQGCRVRDAVGIALEDGGARLAQRLGAVHGHVGVAQHVLGLLVPGRAHRHADAGARLDALGADLEGIAHHVVHPIRHVDRVARVAHVVEPHGEFVAAVARQRVAFAQAGGQPARDLLEQLIARFVAEGVVDYLEAIDVDEEHGESVVVVAAQPVERMAQQVEEERPVGKAGERVVARVVRHPVDQHAVAGDVAHQARHADGGAGRIAPRGAPHRDPAPFSVGMAQPMLVLEDRGAPFEVGGERGAQRRGVLGMHAVEPLGRAARRRVR